MLNRALYTPDQLSWGHVLWSEVIGQLLFGVEMEGTDALSRRKKKFLVFRKPHKLSKTYKMRGNTHLLERLLLKRFLQVPTHKLSGTAKSSTILCLMTPTCGSVARIPVWIDSRPFWLMSLWEVEQEIAWALHQHRISTNESQRKQSRKCRNHKKEREANPHSLWTDPKLQVLAIASWAL